MADETMGSVSKVEKYGAFYNDRPAYIFPSEP